MNIKVLFFILFLPLIGLSQDYTEEIRILDEYIEEARRQWQTPGLAVAVVKDGKVLLTKGYGVRELGEPDKVDSQTLFAQASTTKAMTAACMALLVDEGKVIWDDRVIEHLPDFQLYDPFVTRELRVRDLFTHNAGLGNADFLWYGADLEPAEILRRMRLVEPAYSLRSNFIYQNIMYLAAGAVIEKVSGQPWEVFIQERLYKPLGMTRTFPMLHFVENIDNQSVPHHYVKEKITPIENAAADAIGPAGSAWSCVDDMARWVQFMLDSARVDGRRLLKAETYAELLRPQAIIPAGQFYPTAQLTRPHWMTYAMGWFQHDYQGRAVSFHTGSLDGTVAIAGLIPDERLGVYVFGNLDHAEVRHAIMYKVFDIFAGETAGRDWSSEFLDLYTGIRDEAREKSAENERARIPDTTPSHPVEAYAGSYVHPLYGKIDVTHSNNSLSATFNGKLKASLEHWHYDVFRIHYEKAWIPSRLLSFGLSDKGEIASIALGDRVFQLKNNGKITTE